MDADGLPVIDAGEPEWSAEVNGKSVRIEFVTRFDPKNDGWEWKIDVDVDSPSAEIAYYFQEHLDGRVGGGSYGAALCLGWRLRGPLFRLRGFLMSNVYADGTGSGNSG